MNNLLQQLPALVGVVIGAVASFLAGNASERARWRRRQTTRWDKRRLEAYTDYAYAVKDQIHLATRIAAHLKLNETLQPLDPAEGLELLQAANQTRSVKWETLLLLGTPAAVAAARRWHVSAWRLQDFALGKRTGRDAWNEAFAESGTARHSFYETARRDLGVSGTPPLPPP
jgi:hypothetical protein